MDKASDHWHDLEVPNSLDKIGMFGYNKVGYKVLSILHVIAWISLKTRASDSSFSCLFVDESNW